MDHLKLTVDKLSVEEISELVVDDSCGAVSLFVGTTRDNFEGKKVVSLEYEAYEAMALKAMKALCEDARRQWPALHSLAIYHRLGSVPSREASVVIAASSPHRADALAATAALIEGLKAKVPIWKKEVYADGAPAWKENVECSPKPASPPPCEDDDVQINVSTEVLEQRIRSFIERKREQVNMSNIHDFIPSACAGAEEESCARVRTQLVKRLGSKGHLKIHKVHNEWGPQTVRHDATSTPETAGLPAGLAERLRGVETFLSVKGPVPKDIYARLKVLEDRIATLEAVSPEYKLFWKISEGADEGSPSKQIKSEDCLFSSADIAKRIERLENQA